MFGIDCDYSVGCLFHLFGWSFLIVLGSSVTDTSVRPLSILVDPTVRVSSKICGDCEDCIYRQVGITWYYI